MEDSLLVKYLLNETNPEEDSAVKSWIEEDPENLKYFDQFRWIWIKSGELSQEISVDENAAWERFLVHRQSAERNRPTSSQRFLYSTWAKLAAAIVLLVAITAVVLSFLPHSGKALYSNVAISSSQEPIKEVLLDGSVLTLNKNTKLSYVQKWLGKERLVNFMAGEVYFEIEKNPQKPFVIATGNVNITVLGTSFNVKKAGGETIVTVNDGVVKVAAGQEALILRKNEKAIVFQNTGRTEKSSATNQLYKYYVSNKFVAKNIKLTELMEVLNEAYGAEIEVSSERARNLNITTTLQYGSLEENLEIISQTLGLRITKTGDNTSIE